MAKSSPESSKGIEVKESGKEGTGDPYEEPGLDSPVGISRLIIEGRSSEALAQLRDHLAAEPDDQLAKSELACALAYSGQSDEAQDILRELGDSPEDPLERSRVGTAWAILASNNGDLPSIGGHLDQAYEDDPWDPLLQLLMGRYFMIVNKDLSQAEFHLRRLVDEIPSSSVASMHLATVLSESGKRREGRNLAVRNAFAHPGSLAAGLLAFFAFLLTLPMDGGVFLAALVVLLLVPYLGPLIIAGWLILTVATFLTLFRIWQRMALASALVLGILIIGYITRSIVWGRIFP
jgi:tetratricopeptide (TPR) repeat protein